MMRRLDPRRLAWLSIIVLLLCFGIRAGGQSTAKSVDHGVTWVVDKTTNFRWQGVRSGNRPGTLNEDETRRKRSFQ
jgi:hypothetical protein